MNGVWAITLRYIAWRSETGLGVQYLLKLLIRKYTLFYSVLITPECTCARMNICCPRCLCFPVTFTHEPYSLLGQHLANPLKFSDHHPLFSSGAVAFKIGGPRTKSSGLDEVLAAPAIDAPLAQMTSFFCFPSHIAPSPLATRLIPHKQRTRLEGFKTAMTSQRRRSLLVDIFQPPASTVTYILKSTLCPIQIRIGKSGL